MARISKSARIQLWLDRLNRHATSGQTVAEFCRHEQVSIPSFYQWKRRLSPRVEACCGPLPKRSGLPNDQNTNPNGFAELVVHSSQTLAQAILPGDITISLGTEPEIATLIVDRLLKHSAGMNRHEAGSC